MASVLEYLVEEILQEAGNYCKEQSGKDIQRPRIKPKHIQMAISRDDELSKLCHTIHISEGGQELDKTGTMALLWPKHKSAKTGSTATQE